LILNLQRRLAITTLFVTHDQEEAVILADQIGLIFAGRLQQVGAPRDFYERPSTPKVARFFGGANFLPGRKRGRRVETPLGDFETEVCHLPDGPVTLTIRPEDIVFNGAAATNTTPGRIKTHRYAGAHTRFQVETAVPHLPPLTVIGAASGPLPQAGENVYLHLPPEKIWLMEKDEG
jgi:ABC-type Fe3+/spermidine/putrescine transport system ATPase subunit